MLRFFRQFGQTSVSHFVWSAWIEIIKRNSKSQGRFLVALRMKCVDWNPTSNDLGKPEKYVALRMKCVDWNFDGHIVDVVSAVSHFVWSAWIEIGGSPINTRESVSSHFVWSAWIEMASDFFMYMYFLVALRMKCVDWNRYDSTRSSSASPSHFVWSAWIEIFTASLTSCIPARSHFVWSAWIEMIEPTGQTKRLRAVALRMKCVDWNIARFFYLILSYRRTSYEVRGLKWSKRSMIMKESLSHFVWSAWIEIELALR